MLTETSITGIISFGAFFKVQKVSHVYHLMLQLS